MFSLADYIVQKGMYNEIILGDLYLYVFRPDCFIFPE